METKKKRKRSAKVSDDEEISTKLAKTALNDMDAKLGKFICALCDKRRFVINDLNSKALLMKMATTIMSKKWKRWKKK